MKSLLKQANRGDILTITSYYGAKSTLTKKQFPLRMEFEVLSWPTTTNLRDFVYSFTHHWLDRTLLPLQSSEIKWNKITIRWAHSGQDFVVPLVGKYGHYQGPQSPDKLFEVNLISSCSSKKAHYFRLRGVADDYELFDRPERENSHIIERTNALEAALLSPLPWQPQVILRIKIVQFYATSN